VPPNNDNLTPFLVPRDLRIGYLFRRSRLNRFIDFARRYPVDQRKCHLLDREVVDGFGCLVREKHAVDIRPHLEAVDIIVGVVVAEVAAAVKEDQEQCNAQK